MHDQLFERQAALYARHRPTYPRELYEFLAAAAPGHRLAVDCGAGNGQASVALAEYFEQVLAIDVSAEQIAHHSAHPRVRYVVALAELLPAATGSADLILAAQAAHWFNLENFYAEAERVLVPGGVLAICGYKFTQISSAIDAVINRLYHDVVGAYWSPRVRMVELEYRELQLPFAELPAPRLWIEVDWSLDDLLGYVMSWSATQSYIAARGDNPLERVQADLAAAWGPATLVRRVRWPLSLRVARK